MRTRVPSYRLHKSSGQAVVTIDGKDYYLGPYGAVDSHAKYGQLIARRAATGTGEVPKPSSDPGATIEEVVLAFLRHAQKYYSKNGETTAEYQCFKSAVRPLIKLYGETSVEDFTPNCLLAVQTQMINTRWTRKGKKIDRYWSRGYINKSISRIRKIFRWAKPKGLIKTKGLVEDLRTLEPLLEGRSEAVELPPRKPVPVEHIEAIRAKVNRRTRDMIDLCLGCGCRPGELVSLTTGMIDRTGDIWTATLISHKTQHHGKARMLAFGAKEQLILRRHLLSHPDLRIFPIRRDTFSKTIAYWCKKLNLPHFTGHWLRHNAATETRNRGSLDDAQVLLGHSDQKTTQKYAHLQDTRVIELARKRG